MLHNFNYLWSPTLSAHDKYDTKWEIVCARRFCCLKACKICIMEYKKFSRVRVLCWNWQTENENIKKFLFAFMSALSEIA